MSREITTSPVLVNMLLGVPVLAIAGWFIYGNSHQPSIFIASTFFILICSTDILFTKIPNLLNLVLLLLGFSYNLYLGGTGGLIHALLGTLAGFALFLVPYLLGMGAGDVKALSALGALLGPSSIFEVFLYTVLIGGVLALLHYALHPDTWKKSRSALIRLRVFMDTWDSGILKPVPKRQRQRFPYSTAIALGYFAFIQWGPVVKLLLNDKI